ncbi:MAG TPA: hypothetical protein VFI46_09145 [Jiangellaceae bacterium]|nr:hypothetical protein [Jiangellaceae bacterium]
MKNPTRAVRTAVLIMAAVGLCGSCSAPPSASPSAPSTSSAEAELVPQADRCGEPENPAAQAFELTGPNGATMPAVTVGSGSTVAVLLHQTDNVAMCGWWAYANWLTTQAEVQALLFDLCGFGEAVCTEGQFATDQIGQVELAVAYARDHGATRVVIVGASMGGSVALHAAVAVDADAVVDLSGPVTWRELRAEMIAPELTLPTLIAVSPDDDIDRRAYEAFFPTIPASEKKLVIPESGHGWDMLEANDTVTPLATTVKDWIVGQYG